MISPSEARCVYSNAQVRNCSTRPRKKCSRSAWPISSEEQKIFAEAAAKIDPTRNRLRKSSPFWKKDHPSEKTLVPDTRQRLENIRQFVIDRDLVTFPSQVPVMVAETPKFERHNSFAMMDAPGPFEKSAEAFYYVTPTEPDWDAKRKEEWLARFFYYDNDVTTIHEAYPGHYVQFLHLKASSATVPEKIFGSYAYIEGWAHYCEQMVIDEGYPAGADSLTRSKYRVAQSQDAILRLCRLCVSVQMHCQGMTVDQATKFFMDNCYYGEAPARAEAERGTFDPGYCFYTLGKLQFLKLREDYRRQEGANFTITGRSSTTRCSTMASRRFACSAKCYCPIPRSGTKRYKSLFLEPENRPQ